MSIRFTHINIVSRDWRKLVKFYEEVFDCVPIPPEKDYSGPWLDKGTGVNNAHIYGTHLRLPGTGDNGPTLEIFQYENTEKKSLPVAANREGFAHIAFHVDDVRAIYEKALLNGGHELGKITTREIKGIGVLTFVYITDPEGNIIEIQNWS
jgi:predicted enzyme related to lactoylglutathione lyase